MPSDPQATAAPPSDPKALALTAIARPAEAFRSAVAAAADEVRGRLSRAAPENGASASLGAFASGRIDVSRFTGLVTRQDPLDSSALESLRAAAEALGRVAGSDPAGFSTVRVPAGGDLAAAVRKAYADLGRAFSAARVAAAARSGAPRGPDAPTLGALDFARWTRRERRVAPPLLVEVDGHDLVPGALAEFLDGAAKIVLVVKGPCAPAPLARLVTPSVHVLQTADATGLDAFAAYGGPGVAAIVPEGCALFAHDPAAGFTLAERLSVRRMPDGEPRGFVGPFSPAQQADELRQLSALAEKPKPAPVAAAATAKPGAPAAPPAPAAPSAPADPASRLAAFLLSTVDPKDLR